MTPAGFPHSDIPGSQLGCSSPRLIAASYVLHRLLMPRHPPCALSNLPQSLLISDSKMLASTMQFSRYGRDLTSHALPAVLRRSHEVEVPNGTDCSVASLRTQQRAWADSPRSRVPPASQLY